MFDKYSKRNTKSMSNKRNCLKHLFLISLIALIFASCSPSAYKPNETASVRVEAMSLTTASIVPGTPKPTKYTLELKPSDGESIKPEPSTTGIFSIPDVPVGTYTVIIIAYDGEKEILKGEASLTVKPNSENKATVIMNYILNGSGILSVTIDWTGLTANNQVYTAIHDYKTLGFRAVYAEGEKKGHPINGVEDSGNEDFISWVPSENLTSGTFEYRVEGLEPTSGTAIVFQIYTKINGNIQLIAETFPTVMQIYDGLVSKPDQNEGQNFKLDANHIISYLENVTVSKDDVKPNADSPSTAIDITWKNPTSLDADNLPFYVLVTAIDNDNSSPTIQVKSDPYEAAGGEGSVTISGLTENHTYNIKFQVIGKEGYSNNTQLLTGVQPKIVVEKIEFVNQLNDSYTMGNSITIEGKVSPDNASNKDYKITITDGSEVNKEIAVTASTTSEQRTFKFETSGNYRITLTADDNGKDVSKEIKVKLATPTNLQYVEEPNESGITISWKPVESAEGYKVIRVIDGVDSSTEIDAQTAVTYTDKDVDSGHTYAYKVYAYRTDNTLNSLPTDATTSINVSIADITIVMPESLSEIGNVLSKLKGESITIGSGEQIELAIKNNIAKDAYYEWILNEDFDNPIKEGNFDTASSLIISEENDLKKNASDGNTTNSLVLRVTVNGKKETATGYFQVINNNSAGSLTGIKTPESLENNTVYYGEPILLEAVFANSSAEKPDVTWSSSNPNVMSVDKTGLVTTYQKGEPVEITVTVNDTQETKSITLTPYVKAKSISFTCNEYNILILTKPSDYEIGDSRYYMKGVHAFDSGASFNYGSLDIGKPGDNIDVSGDIEISYDEDIISIDELGNVTPVKSGTATITARIYNNFEKTEFLTDSIIVYVYDFEISINNTLINSSSSWQYEFDNYDANKITLKINNTPEEIDFIKSNADFEWCFEAESGNNKSGLSGGSLMQIVKDDKNPLIGYFTRQWLVRRTPHITVLISANSKHIGTVGFVAN